MPEFRPQELAALDTMFELAPRDWWQFVPCAYCNASRCTPCQSTIGPAHKAHASRVRSAHVLHGTLWLLRNGFAADVIGAEADDA